MAAIIKLGLFVLLWITSTNCSSDLTLPEGEPYSTTGNSTDKLQWFKPAQMFIELILPNDVPFPDNITEVVKGNAEFDYVIYIRKVLQAEIGILILIIIGFLIAIILPIVLLVRCCCCCCCQAQAASPKAHKSRRCLTASLILLLLATLPGVIYLFGSTNMLKKFATAAEQKVTNTLNDALIYLNNTKMQINYLAPSNKQGKLSADLEIDKSLGSNIKKGLDVKMEVTKFLKAISLTSSNMKNATDIIAQINTALDSPQFQTLLTDVRNLKDEISRHCISGTCSDKLKSEVQKLPVGPVHKILPIDTYLTDLDKNLKKAEDAFNGIPLEVKQQSASIVENVKDSLKQLELGLSNVTDTLTTYGGHIEDAKALVDDKMDSKIVQAVKNYLNYSLTAVAAFILIIWLLFCFGVFFGSICYQGTYMTEERTCGSDMGGLFLVIGVAVMLLGSSGLWFINSVLMAVGAHGEQFVCKSLYDTEFRFINRVISILPANLTTIQNTNISLFELKNILNNCENNVGVYQTFQLQKFVKLHNYSEKYDVHSEIKKLSSQIRIGSLDSDLVPDQLEADLDQFAKIFTNAPQQILNEMYLKRTMDELPDTNIEAIDDRKRKIQLEVVKLDLKMIQTNWETLVKYASETKQTSVIGKDLKLKLQLNDIESIVKEEITKFAENVEMHAKEYSSFVNDSIQSKIGGCRPVWNLYDSFRSLVCHDTIYPFNGFWFALGWCLFLLLPMSVIACKLSRHFRRLPMIDSGFDYRDRDEISRADWGK